MYRIKGSIWKTGTKDDMVYFEIWNGDNTMKIIDGDLLPEQAYNIGHLLIDNAIKQGYKLDDRLGANMGDLSNVTIDGKQQTWQQLYEREYAKNLELQGYQTMLNDLSRNEHGRHEGDVDGNGPSRGNPHLTTGQVIGYSIGGSWKYVVPEPRLRGDLQAWRVRAT